MAAYLFWITRYFSMQIENHTLLLHSFEDWIVYAIVLNTSGRVCGHATRIRLDTYDILAFCME